MTARLQVIHVGEERFFLLIDQVSEAVQYDASGLEGCIGVMSADKRLEIARKDDPSDFNTQDTTTMTLTGFTGEEYVNHGELGIVSVATAPEFVDEPPLRWVEDGHADRCNELDVAALQCALYEFHGGPHDFRTDEELGGADSEQ